MLRSLVGSEMCIRDRMRPVCLLAACALANSDCCGGISYYYERDHSLFSGIITVPQGSILSVTLFCLKIKSIVKAHCPGVDFSLYVDDFLICYRSKHIHIIERHLQRCLNNLQEWADTNGFKFSTTKTVCVHFCRLRKLHCDPQLSLNGCPLPAVEEVKFLGVIFDKKLSFCTSVSQMRRGWKRVAVSLTDGLACQL